MADNEVKRREASAAHYKNEIIRLLRDVQGKRSLICTYTTLVTCQKSERNDSTGTEHDAVEPNTIDWLIAKNLQKLTYKQKRRILSCIDGMTGAPAAGSGADVGEH